MPEEKFNKDSYSISGGLHGVGASVVNALSSFCTVEVYRGGFVWRQSYEKGQVISPVEKVEATTKTGTKTSFKPDREIFTDEKTVFSFDMLATRFRELAFLNQGLKIQLKDERSGREETFCYKEGLKEFVSYMNKGVNLLNKDVLLFEGIKNEAELQIAFQWSDSYKENIFSYCNNIRTTEGGSHLVGFRAALTKTLNSYAHNEKLLKELKNNMEGEDVREGLTAVISIKLKEPPNLKDKLKQNWETMRLKGLWSLSLVKN